MQCEALTLARRAAELQQKEQAQRAYTLALHELGGRAPQEELEAASYLFFSGGDYRSAYNTFVSLYNRGHYQPEVMEIMTQAFYLPNVQEQMARYQKNCAALRKYPYLFRQDFPAFDDLPILFFPFEENSYFPFPLDARQFEDCVNVCDPVIDRNFFHDLENPILAKDVYSQYQLEYLYDNVRKSEWVGRDNHIYLHYTDWARFCAYLACLDFTVLLKAKKFVFLFGEEVSRYPIDFAADFGIDYSVYPVKPITYDEVTRLIWHTQLATHNGGDFFNEIFHQHPNLLTTESIIYSNLVDELKERKRNMIRQMPRGQKGKIRRLSDKDVLVAYLFSREDSCDGIDFGSRICPAVLFQPHFKNLEYRVKVYDKRHLSTLASAQYEMLQNSPMLQGFKYIKTFTPMRRITTSYAATVRFMYQNVLNDQDSEESKHLIVLDEMTNRLQNRSFMIDPADRLYRDSVLVRFEDAKLNPKATFTALADFLDIPYTHSMTYCSGAEGLDPESLAGNVRGFDPAAVYKTYDEYANADERALLEYFLRDAYQEYGYDMLYYKGEPVDEQWVQERLSRLTCLDGYIAESLRLNLRSQEGDAALTEEEIDAQCDAYLQTVHDNRAGLVMRLLEGLRFYNQQGEPLRMMKKLALDPALLEQPLYH